MGFEELREELRRVLMMGGGEFENQSGRGLAAKRRRRRGRPDYHLLPSALLLFRFAVTSTGKSGRCRGRGGNCNGCAEIARTDQRRRRRCLDGMGKPSGDGESAQEEAKGAPRV
ncbi:hypothetical protein Drorol1_Dr00016626 [Drosera rotundifolia]